jgi:phage terminase large subunit GpA-like protein
VSTKADLTNANPTVVAAYEASDQRHYFVPCPHCGHEQRLRWAQVKWMDGDPDTAHYECESCDQAWNDAHRIESLALGRWIATYSGRKSAGFFLNELYSPFVLLAKVAAEFLEAKKSPETLKTWTNTSLGETWKDMGGDQRQPEALLERCEDYDCSDSAGVPDGVVWIDCGVDTQDDRLELEFVGWGPGEESWGLDYAVLMGPTDAPEVWRRLSEQLERVFIREDGARLPVSVMLIDSGGHATSKVYDFCTKHRRARACVGRSDVIGKGGAKPPTTKPGKVEPGGRRKPWVIGVDGLKSTLLKSRLLIKEVGPRYCHFPRSYNLRHFEQLTAEVALIKYKSGVAYTVWDAGKRRNEALDCRVLAMAGVHMEKPNFELLRQRLMTEAAVRRGAQAPAPRQKPRPLARVASKYLGR